MSAKPSVLQAIVLSTVMFASASQFAFVGVLSGGGAALAAVFTALLLGPGNATLRA